MNSKMLKFMFIILLMLALSILASQQSQIKQINSKIVSLKNRVSKKEAQKKTLNTQLKSIEQKINVLNNQLRDTNKKIKPQKQLLNVLEKRQKQYQTKLKIQRNQLAKQLRAAYQIGEKGYLQLLLSQKDPNQFSRMMVYSQALNAAQQKLIQQFLESLKKVKNNQRKINIVLAVLQPLKQNQLVEQRKLKRQKQSRSTLLKTINRQIKTSRQRIIQLQRNKKRLQDIVGRLKAQKTMTQFSGVAFGRLRHRLQWPVKGRITRNYGQVYDGRLISKGVFISAPIGRMVHAVASGKVIFSNWLRGYGNLIIVSHKGNYMTLYAHNNALFKQVGDTVKPGEEIALVGNSGGLAKAGLYFEIRYKGKTRDPAQWCRF